MGEEPIWKNLKVRGLEEGKFKVSQYWEEPPWKDYRQWVAPTEMDDPFNAKDLISSKTFFRRDSSRSRWVQIN